VVRVHVRAMVDHDVSSITPREGVCAVRIRLVTPISYLNQTSSRRALRDWFCALAGSTATENRTKANAQALGSNPITVRGREAGAVMRSLNAACEDA